MHRDLQNGGIKMSPVTKGHYNIVVMILYAIDQLTIQCPGITVNFDNRLSNRK